MKTERELYQEHYKNSRDYKFYVKHEMTEKQIFDFKSGRYSVDCVNDGWKIWQASAQRDGYKLVPVEPSAELVNHGHQVFLGHFNEGGQTGGRSLYFTYKAMIGTSE